MVPVLRIDTSTFLTAALLLKSHIWVLLYAFQALFNSSKITNAPVPNLTHEAAPRRKEQQL